MEEGGADGADLPLGALLPPRQDHGAQRRRRRAQACPPDDPVLSGKKITTLLKILMFKVPKKYIVCLQIPQMFLTASFLNFVIPKTVVDLGLGGRGILTTPSQFKKCYYKLKLVLRIRSC